MSGSLDSSSSNATPQPPHEEITYPPKGSLQQLACRSLRFGTLRTSPAQPFSFHVTTNGFVLYVKESQEMPWSQHRTGFAHEQSSNTASGPRQFARPPIHARRPSNDFESFNVQISWRHIKQIFYCFSARLSVMFIKVSENAGERLRATFRMPEKQPPDDDHGYFDPQSTREFYRYITLVLTEDARGLAKTEFEGILRELKCGNNPNMEQLELYEMGQEAANRQLIKTLAPNFRPGATVGGPVTRKNPNPATANRNKTTVGANTALAVLHSENTGIVASPSTSSSYQLFQPFSSTSLVGSVRITRSSIIALPGVRTGSSTPLSFSQPRFGQPVQTATSPPQRLIVMPSSQQPISSMSRNLRPTATRPPKLRKEPEVLFSYLPLVGGEILIHDTDMACLEEGEFLNDIIIDFYLDYLVHSLPEDQRQRLHVFSTYFWTKLSSSGHHGATVAKNQNGLDSQSKKRDLMHSKVARWTKNVDLFEKDFILIPINEDAHWYLAIICYPGLVGPCYLNDADGKDEEAKNGAPELDSNGQQEQSSNAAPTSSTIDLSSSQERLEQSTSTAEKTNVESDPSASIDVDKNEPAKPSSLPQDTRNGEMTSSVEECTSQDPSPPKRPKLIERQSSRQHLVKQPSIIMLDSLKEGPQNYKTTRMIRDYLMAEWAARKPNEAPRDFSQKVLKGLYPIPPQQQNYSDCGVFLLEYAERFLFNGLLGKAQEETPGPTKDVGQDFWTNFALRMKNFDAWFKAERVAAKRRELKELLLKLAEDWKTKQVNVQPEPSPPLEPVKSDDIIMVSHETGKKRNRY